MPAPSNVPISRVKAVIPALDLRSEMKTRAGGSSPRRPPGRMPAAAAQASNWMEKPALTQQLEARLAIVGLDNPRTAGSISFDRLVTKAFTPASLRMTPQDFLRCGDAIGRLLQGI